MVHKMAWLSALGHVFYYLLLPFTLLLRLLVTVLAPLLYLGSYMFSGMLFPLRLLAHLEVQRCSISNFQGIVAHI
jgi:hypothetical protein